MNVQELILKKLHGGTQVCCTQHITLMIDTNQILMVANIDNVCAYFNVN
jgi:hypothetical protein